MADETTTVDYLGAESPLSLTDKAALPVGGAPAGASAGPTASTSAAGTASGTRSATGTTATPSVSTSPRTVTTTSAGMPGVTGEPAPRSSNGGGSLDFQALIAKIGDLLGKLKVPPMDGPKSTLDPSQFTLAGEGGADVLSPSDFTLTGEGGAALKAEDFTLGKARLDTSKLPGPLRTQVMQAFTAAGLDPSKFTFGGEAGDVLDPSQFSLSSEGGADVLSPGNFSLGVDPSIASSPQGAGLGVGDAPGLIGPALSLAQFGHSLAGAGGDGAKIGGALVKAAIAAAPALAGYFATEGLSLAEAGATAGGGSVMGFWNVPQLADTIANLLDPPNTKRTMDRSLDAMRLRGDILGPLANVSTPEELFAALSTEVGGSTVGDALASVLNLNLEGGWAPGGDAGMGWNPDPYLAPIQQALHAAGFRGTDVENGTIVRREPSRNDVGGVGEMIAGGGLRVRNPNVNTDALLRMGIDPETNQGAVQALIQGDDPRYNDLTGTRAWDVELRRLASVPDDAPSVFDFKPQNVTDPDAQRTAALKVGIDPDTNRGAYDAWLRETPPQTDPYADYMAQLEAMDPAVADLVAHEKLLEQQNIQAQYDAAQNAGGG